MTMTEPSATIADEGLSRSSSAITTASFAKLFSSDHKVVGRGFLLTALVVGAAGFVFSSIIDVERAGSGISIVGDSLSTFFNLGWSLIAPWAVVPGLLGLALVVIPMQVGAGNAALPRLAQFAMWTYWFALGLLALSFIVGNPVGVGFISSLPLAANPQGASEAQLLWISAHLFLSLSCIVVSAVLVTTAICSRRPGMKLIDAPLTTWAGLSVGIIQIVAGAASWGATLLFLVDQKVGGTVFETRGGEQLWQHALYFWNRPEILVINVLAAGMLCDIASSSMKRALLGHKIAAILLSSSAVLTLMQWTAKPHAIQSIFPATETIFSTLWIVPFLWVFLLVLATLRPIGGHSPKMSVPLVGVLSAFCAIGVGIVFAIVAGTSELPGGTTFEAGQVTIVIFAIPLIALSSGVIKWSPQILNGRKVSNVFAFFALMSVIGGLLIRIIGFQIAGLAKAAWFVGDVSLASVPSTDGPISESVFKQLSVLSALGAILVASGLVGVVKLAAFSLLWKTRKPYGVKDNFSNDGVTLEWAYNPRAAANFDAVPPVFGPAPLIKVAKYSTLQTQSDQPAEGISAKAAG